MTHEKPLDWNTFKTGWNKEGKVDVKRGGGMRIYYVVIVSAWHQLKMLNINIAKNKPVDESAA